MTGTTLEDAMEALLAEAYTEATKKHPSDEWLLAMSMRAGTTGTVAKLEPAGQAIGVTRERVRQVMGMVTDRLKGRSLPGLEDVAAELISRSPVEEPIGVHLSALGLTRPTLSGEAFLNFFALLGTTPKELLGTDLLRVDGWLVKESEAQVVKAVAMANRHTSAYGMTTVEEIRQALSTQENQLDAGDIKRILDREPSVRWAGEWLWMQKKNDGQHANRLVNTARTILSVNSPQTVSSIHEGARRLWKFRKLDILPPVEAMIEFFRNSPYFVVDGDLVQPVQPVDYRDIVGPTTAAMIDVLKSATHQVMDRQSLHEACDDAGIAKGTYGIWTTYAEWMENFGPNVWGLRGSSPNPGAVEAIRKAARARLKSEPRRKSWSWSADGRVIWTMDATTAFTSTGVLSWTPDIRKMLASQSLGVTIDGKQVATAKVGDDHTFCWGWHPAITASGTKRGDVVRITISLTARTAEFEVGGQELWH